jgi:hypothetical protein
MEDTAGVMHTFSVTTSGNSITQIRLDSSVTGQTGTMTHRSGNIFGFTLNDGTVGGFFLNSAQTHAAFVDDEFNFGVVQRGASALPAYALTDLVGSYSGVAVSVSANFGTFTTATATASCSGTSSITCTAVDSGVTTTASFTSAGFTGCPGGSGITFGRWCGSFTASNSTSGNVRAFLSVDKTFGAVWACTAGTFPTACEFSAWSE